MIEFRKITVEIPKDDLESAQACTGKGGIETVRMALKGLRQRRRSANSRNVRNFAKYSGQKLT